MKLTRHAMLAFFLSPAALLACGRHGAPDTVATVTASLVLPLLALGYPIWVLFALTRQVLGDPKGGTRGADWGQGGILLAYTLVFLGGLLLIDSFWSGTGKFAPPVTTNDRRPVGDWMLLPYMVWFVLVLLRTARAVSSESPRNRSLRRMTRHPLWYLPVAIIPGALFLLLLMTRPSDQQPVVGFLCVIFLLPIGALLYHDLLFTVHQAADWVADRWIRQMNLRMSDVTHVTTGTCPVCADPLTWASRACASCQTRHHPECHDFAGGCAMYGCPEAAPPARGS